MAPRPHLALLLLTALPLTGCLGSPDIQTTPRNDLTIHLDDTKELTVWAENTGDQPRTFTLTVDPPQFIHVTDINNRPVNTLHLGDASTGGTTSKKVLQLELRPDKVTVDNWRTVTADLTLTLHANDTATPINTKTIQITARNEQGRLL